MKQKSYILVIAGALAMVACGEAKKIDRMHDATLEMRDTTKDLLATSKDMKAQTLTLSEVSDSMNKKMETTVQAIDRSDKNVQKSTDAVLQTTQVSKRILQETDEIYDATRQGVSLDLRRTALQRLSSEPASGAKIAEASKYFMSFEYQLWHGRGQDTLVKRHELLTDAVLEFFKDLRAFDSGTEMSSATARADREASSSASLDAGFNALSVALHRVNRKQEEMHRQQPEVPVMSMLTLIESALAKEKGVDDGSLALSELKGWEREVLLNKRLALRLLQARHNVIALVFLSEVSPLVQGVIAYTKASWAGWTFEVDKYNLAQVSEFAKYLKAATETRNNLQKIGVTPVIDGTVENFFKKMSVVTAGKGSAEINAARMELLGALRPFLKGVQAPEPAAKSVPEPQTMHGFQ